MSKFTDELDNERGPVEGLDPEYARGYVMGFVRGYHQGYRDGRQGLAAIVEDAMKLTPSTPAGPGGVEAAETSRAE